MGLNIDARINLAGKSFNIRATTRKADSDAAKTPDAAGAEVVKADLNDAASLETAWAGARGVFAVQNAWEAGVARQIYNFGPGRASACRTARFQLGGSAGGARH